MKRAVFIFLWIGWFWLLPRTFLVAVVTGDDSGIKLWWVSSVVLALTAWINWLIHRQDSFGSFTFLIAVGMTFGMLADIYGTFEAIRFTGLLPMTTVLFSLGHIGYIWGMLIAAQQFQLQKHPHWKKILPISLTVYCVIGIGFWILLVKPSEYFPRMHLPLLVYTLFLSMTATIMTTVAILKWKFFPMGIGSFLFLASDIFLAVKLFQDNCYGIGDFCWITYGISQMLIVFGSIRK